MTICRNTCALEMAQCDIMQGVLIVNEKDRVTKFNDALSHIDNAYNNPLEKKKLLQSLFNRIVSQNYNEYYTASEFILRQKLIDINVYDGHCYPLHCVKDADWIPYLYAKGIKFDVIDCTGKTPLMCAAELGKYDLLVKLIMHEANCDVFTKTGESALSLAITNGHRACVEMLLKMPGIKNSVNRNVVCYYDENRDQHILSVPPFIIAIIRNDYFSFNMLLSTQLMAVNFKDVNEKTILHYMSEFGMPFTFLRFWIDSVSVIDIKDKGGNTPLNYFIQEVIFQVENNNKNIEEYMPHLRHFLKKNSDPTISNKNGISPLSQVRDVKSMQSFEIVMNNKVTESNKNQHIPPVHSMRSAIKEMLDARNFISSIQANYKQTTFSSKPVKSSRKHDFVANREYRIK